jgi:hypothetical protein
MAKDSCSLHGAEEGKGEKGGIPVHSAKAMPTMTYFL